MTDSRLHSLHLEGLPRREEYRAARDRLLAGCGNMTLAGDINILNQVVEVDAATQTAPLGALMNFWLQDNDQILPLIVGINTIGRLPDNTITIRDEHVSRRHCAIVVHRSGICEIYDVASKNGTIVNGQKIKGSTRLNPGDTVTLCTKKLMLLSGRQTELPKIPAATQQSVKS